VNIHPELGLRLAQVKFEEARSRAERASAARAAVLEREASGDRLRTAREKSGALRFATLGRRTRARRRSEATLAD